MRLILLIFIFLISSTSCRNIFEATPGNCLTRSDITKESYNDEDFKNITIKDYEGDVSVWDPENSFVLSKLTGETCTISVKKQGKKYVVFSSIIPSYIKQPIELDFLQKSTRYFFTGHNIGSKTNDVFILQQASTGASFTHTMVSDESTIETLVEEYEKGVKFPEAGYNKGSSEGVLQYGKCATSGFHHKECLAIDTSKI